MLLKDGIGAHSLMIGNYYYYYFLLLFVIITNMNQVAMSNTNSIRGSKKYRTKKKRNRK